MNFYELTEAGLPNLSVNHTVPRWQTNFCSTIWQAKLHRSGQYLSRVGVEAVRGKGSNLVLTQTLSDSWWIPFRGGLISRYSGLRLWPSG